MQNCGYAGMPICGRLIEGSDIWQKKPSFNFKGIGNREGESAKPAKRFSRYTRGGIPREGDLIAVIGNQIVEFAKLYKV